MTANFHQRGKLWLTTGFLVLILDRIIKWYFLTNVSLNLSETHGSGLASLFSLSFYLNPKIFLIVSPPLIITQLLVTVVWVVFLVYVWVCYRQNKSGHVVFFIWTVLGGASNLYDRWRFDGVIDYFNLGFLPTFNLADIMIIGGLVGYLVSFKFIKLKVIK